MIDDAQAAPVTVAALYRFCDLPGHRALRAPLLALCRRAGVRGTLILAGEGINGTIAGPRAGIDAVLSWLRANGSFDGMELKLSLAPAMPFHRMKVRLKDEIVTMGVDGVDAAAKAGRHVGPGDWNALIADPGTVLIDTRNDYETALGSFSGALDPGLASFREFPAWLERNRDWLAGRTVAMFCTGGIRCEKATAYARSVGIAEVCQLKGGILAYLEQVAEADSLWRGECFVFDERVAVGHGLRQGAASLCRACRHPLTPAERARPEFRDGVACLHCHGTRTPAALARYEERHRQMAIAAARGIRHIGR